MTMRVLSIAIAALLSLGVGTFGESREKTLTSTDGEYQLIYPASYSLYVPPQLEQLDVPACRRSGSFRYEYRAKGGYHVSIIPQIALACLVYSHPEYVGTHTSFDAAALEIMELPTATTLNACNTFRSLVGNDYVFSSQHHTEMINDAQFSTGTYGSVATGHSEGTWVYRTFHDNKCYELDINVAESNPGESGRYLTDTERHHIREQLEQVLRTFRFLR